MPLPVEIRQIRSARRMRLRFDEARGVLKLTCPVRTRPEAALKWAISQRSWVEAQIARAEPVEPFLPGATIPLEGLAVTLSWSADAPRAGLLDGGRLVLGGSIEAFHRRAETWLKRRALEVMSADVAEFAEAAGAKPASVSVGDAGTRWGSCSSNGRIRLSWRLIMASPEVRRFVAAHEVAHLLHLNHGPKFKALEAALVGPGLARAKALLGREGPRLRRLGRLG